MTCLRRIQLLTAVVVLLWSAATAGERPYPEYLVKGAFLVNFVRYMEWPADTFASEQSPIVIGILGEDPFGPAFDRETGKQSVNQHPLTVRRFDSVAAIDVCHLPYVAIEQDDSTEVVLEQLEGRPIVTVGEQERFLEMGGTIRFLMKENRVRFAVNLDVARAVSIRISSSMLALAEQVLRTE